MMFNSVIKNTLLYHGNLFSGAWSDDVLRKEVRYALLLTAKKFINYLEIPNFRVYDIVLTGSMANYNWTKFSDFDVHIVTKYSDLQCDDIAAEFYKAKKKIWNDEHDIMIRGHEIEMYVEDIEDPPVSGGIYSILNNDWLKKPQHNRPEFDYSAVRSKTRDIARQIDLAIASRADADDLKRLMEKIRKMRQAGLASGGEFSVENLTFKALRNSKHIDKLHQAYNRFQDQSLSIDEMKL